MSEIRLALTLARIRAASQTKALAYLPGNPSPLRVDCTPAATHSGARHNNADNLLVFVEGDKSLNIAAQSGAWSGLYGLRTGRYTLTQVHAGDPPPVLLFDWAVRGELAKI